MSSSDKRPAEQDNTAAAVAAAAKRQCTLLSDTNHKQSDSDNNEDYFLPESHSLSVHYMLSLPLSILLKTSSHTSKPLLSRTEAKVFLRLHMLSQEMDAIVTASSHALSLLHSSRPWFDKDSLQYRYLQHPHVRCMQSLIETVWQRQPQASLDSLQVPLQSVVDQIQDACTSLRALAEQNWTLADSLQETVPDLAREKRLVSDLQEEVCQRIEAIVQDKRSSPVDLPVTSLADYCNQLFDVDNAQDRIEGDGINVGDTEAGLMERSKSQEQAVDATHKSVIPAALDSFDAPSAHASKDAHCAESMDLAESQTVLPIDSLLKVDPENRVEADDTLVSAYESATTEKQDATRVAETEDATALQEQHKSQQTMEDSSNVTSESMDADDNEEEDDTENRSQPADSPVYLTNPMSQHSFSSENSCRQSESQTAAEVLSGLATHI
jgi:hypothetical protein